MDKEMEWTDRFPRTFPPQHQDVHPGIESEMQPRPIFDDPCYVGTGKLRGKVAIITGGDSGIGRAVALAYAKEGADLVIVYFNEHDDAAETKALVEASGRRCLAIAADLGYEPYCQAVVEATLDHFGRLDVLVNNAAMQFMADSILDISTEQWERTLRSNIYSMFFLTKYALPHLRRGSSIINTASITAYRGEKQLLDYSTTKGAIVTFTRTLSLQLADKGIRVNGTAPGPIWTPLIPSSFDAEKVAKFGTKQPLGRAGQPVELAPAYVYLASDESSYMTGQILHLNGGEIVNG